MIGKINLSDRQDFSAGEPKWKAGPTESTREDSVVVGNGAQHKQG